MPFLYEICENRKDSHKFVQINGFEGSARELVVPDSIEGYEVEAIGNHAFSGRNDIESVVLPAAVKTLYGFAFHNCRKLKKISLFDSIDDYYDGVCRQCDSLSDIEIRIERGWYEVIRNFLADNDKTLRFLIKRDEHTSCLVFPEYVYDFSENTMARTIQFSIGGSGMIYRECVDRKSVNYREYDKFFEKAVIDGNAVSEDIAISRVLFPYELSEGYKEKYESFIKKNSRSIIIRLVEDIENNETLREQYYETLFYKIIQTETKSVKQDLIVTFSFKYKEYTNNIRSNQIERAKKSIESNNITRKGKNQNDYRRFIDSINSTNTGEVAENITYTINEYLIQEEAKYDGYYALTTNLNGDINQILKIVKGRWEIEESFRIMKSDFLARPVNLSREDRIKAHFMTCFISLFIYRLLEKKLDYKYTTSQILNTLRNMNMLEQKGLGFEPEYERTDLTDDLHDAFNFNTDLEIVTYKNMKKILD